MFLKKSLLFYCTIWSIVQLIHLATSHAQPARSCVNIPLQPCADLFGGGYTIFPNARELTFEAALGEFLSFSDLLALDNYCSYLANIFLLHTLFPTVCSRTTSNHGAPWSSML